MALGATSSNREPYVPQISDPSFPSEPPRTQPGEGLCPTLLRFPQSGCSLLQGPTPESRNYAQTLSLRLIRDHLVLREAPSDLGDFKKILPLAISREPEDPNPGDPPSHQSQTSILTQGKPPTPPS